MINEASSASVYTDFQGLAELRAAAGRRTPESMRETARQFEALFVQTMLKAMRDASQGDGLLDSDKTDFYRDLHDHQLALEMVKGRGLGYRRHAGAEHGWIAHRLTVSPCNRNCSARRWHRFHPPAWSDQTTPLVNLAGDARPVVDLQATTRRRH